MLVFAQSFILFKTVQAKHFTWIYAGLMFQIISDYGQPVDHEKTKSKRPIKLRINKHTLKDVFALTKLFLKDAKVIKNFTPPKQFDL